MTRNLVLLTLLLVPVLATAEDTLEITRHGAVISLPGMDRVRVSKDVALPGAPKFDLYLPAQRSSKPVPVVVFVNGVGDATLGKLKDWRIYQDWARLVAARGMAAVLHEARAGATAQDLEALLEALRTAPKRLGIDGAQMALWACSANVSTAFPVVMDRKPQGVRAAVMYYGTGAAPELRKDLPVFWVLAGKDSAQLIQGQKALWARALEQDLPWTLVHAPLLPHAFDALDTSPESRRLVLQTLDFLSEQLMPAPAATPNSPGRDILRHSYGHEYAQAEEKLVKRLERAPDEAAAWNALGVARRSQGKTQGSAEAFEKAAKLAPNQIFIRRNLALAWSATGRCAEANPLFAELATAGVKDPFVASGRAVCELAAGSPEVAEKVLAELGPQAGNSRYNVACALALMGKTDHALTQLEKAVEHGFADGDHLAKDPDLASLRDHARFKAVRARLARE